MKMDIVCTDDRYLPQYANPTDGCMDVKVKIEGNCDINSSGVAFIKPGETKIFGTGFQVAIPPEFMMIIVPRSSTGIKLHCELANTIAVIDAGYRDEIKLAITNKQDKTVCLEDAQRVCQLMLVPKIPIIWNRVQDDENFREGDRLGGIGSTGVM